jgi:hypothetical protein
MANTRTILVGRGQAIRTESDAPFRAGMDQVDRTIAPRLAFMTRDHHRVRDFAVRELPRFGRAVSPRDIARGTGLSAARVAAVLDDLERHLFFLVRNRGGDVEWAFPVTVAATAHRLTFSTGERISGA